MSNRKNEFNERASDICESAIASSRNLSEALQACEGLFPTIAVSRFLEIDAVRTQEWLAEASNSSNSPPNGVDRSGSFVLSTWEYFKDNLDAISSIAWQPGARVCLLGAPTLGKLLPASSSEKPHILVDLRKSNSDSIENYIHFAYDINALSGSEFSGAFDACVLDPPWYLDSYLKWIDVADDYCNEGGTIAFSLLGRLTRPSAENDRQVILESCRKSGLTVEIHPNLILYDVPLFEGAILRRAGIPAVPWKRADLVVATRDGHKSTRIYTKLPKKLDLFQEIRLGGITVEIVFDRYNHIQPEKNILIPSEGYWMKTPSRRELGLADCNVFTSNGARFISPRPIELYSGLLSLQRGEFSAIAEGAKQLGFPYDVFSENTCSSQIAL